MSPGYYRLVPPPPLDRYVDHYWILERLPTPLAQRLIPDGTSELIFNLGDPQRLYKPGGGESFDLYRESWFSGTRRIPLTIGADRPASMVGVHFKPYGAYPFFRIPQSDVSNRVVDLEGLWGAEAERVRDRLGRAATVECRFAVLTRALLARMPDRVRNEVVVLRAMTHPDDPADRHVRRLFADRVGLSPKVLQRVLRFQRVLRRLAAPQNIGWAAIARAEGYFDQPHLVRDFREFAGCTPREYLARRGEEPHVLIGA